MLNTIKTLLGLNTIKGNVTINTESYAIEKDMADFTQIDIFYNRTHKKNIRIATMENGNFSASVRRMNLKGTNMEDVMIATIKGVSSAKEAYKMLMNYSKRSYTKVNFAK